MDVLIGARPGSTGPIPTDRVFLDQLFRASDVISLHCPLTAETRTLINAQTLSLMKPTAFLVNTARGALIDESALVDALRNRRIAAAALDVITKEPPPADHPIVRAAQQLDNLMVTPHTAWSARETRERLLEEVEENISSFVSGKPRNIVT
jgi:glycerate dehydrogenase